MVAEAKGNGNGDAGKSTALVLVEDQQRSGGTKPRRVFDLEQVKFLGTIGASRRDMAAYLECSMGVIQSHLTDPDYESSGFRAAYEKGLAQVNVRLRYRQIQMAMAGDVKMLQWLGMNLLGQKAVAKSETSEKLERTFTFTIKQGVDGEGQPTVEMTSEEKPLDQAAGAKPVTGARQFTVSPGGENDE